MIGWSFKRKPKLPPTKLEILARSERYMKRSRNRLIFMVLCVIVVYGVLVGRLIWFGLKDGQIEEASGPAYKISTARPDIVDRNGILLATDIKTYSLFAEPRRIIDANETIELLATILPDLDWQATYNKLRTKAGFAWIERGLTPTQKEKIMALGIPGIGFRTEIRRFYPSGPTASHILGFVNVDNQGIAGMEKYIDQAGLSDLRAAGLVDETSLKPVKLSIDIRVQAIVRDELEQAMQRYSAVSAGAAIINVHTGEVIAMSSVPDFDSNNPTGALQKDHLNRMTAGTYEMGSTIKTFTTAMALDSGKFNLESLVDASKPLAAGRGRFIHDFHGKNRPLHLWEVFVFSSNIGSAKEALEIGIDGHRDFLKRLGLLTRMKTELPEVARPVEPHPWRTVNSMTIAFGHGMMTTPLQTAVGAAALVNGGILIEPTFLQRDEKTAMKNSTRVVSPKTSQDMRYLYKLNADIGSGRNARVDGYRVGGKTGTAEKVENGKYSKTKVFNAFIAAFPIENPQYVVITIIDDPKPEEGTHSTTAGFNAAPMVKQIIKRTATFLGVRPNFGDELTPILASTKGLPETAMETTAND